MKQKAFDSNSLIEIITSFPVKHIKYKTNPKIFQIETGPVLIIPITNLFDIKEFNISYIAFNNLNTYKVCALETQQKKEGDHNPELYDIPFAYQGEILIYTCNN